MVKKLGELLVRETLITEEQLENALQEQKNNGGVLGTHLVKMGYLEEGELLEFLSKQYGVPVTDPSKLDVDPEVIDMIPSNIVQKYKIVPISLEGQTLTIAMVDPSNIFIIDDIRFLTRKNVRVTVATESAIKQAMDRFYDAGANLEDVISEFADDGVDVISSTEELDISELESAAEQAPVVKLVNLILVDAIKKMASDIHIEPYEKSFRVRFRIDGVLYEIMRPPLRLKNALISRIKIMSRLDIAERRLPQDGRIKLKTKGKEMDFRVSVLPTLFGEKVVLRLLDKSNLQLDMTKLGFQEKQLKEFKEAIHKPFGMVLVTGPTGSGKTTTLYSALSELNKTTENISTAEDPVEFNLSGINQVQIHESIGLTFAAALRSFLRQDPDIIMVGEIRDFETAEIAIKAALTGHLVLSTLHTNDAPSTVNRLLNMGVEPFLVASAVNLILAQRLARMICEDCKQEMEVPQETLLDLGVPEEEVGSITCYRGAGCASCNQTGYKGRIALYEVMPLYDEIKELVLVGASTTEIKREAMRLGMLTLRQSGINKLKAGITTVEEVVRCSVKD
ncbi:MAG: type IV-A pilus assembly ATPase PilB [Deltaproteobacteria bacterium]|nr:type IV-A pilus assembly ATPase PilB [Deltaproteobacteria bacterium]MBW2069975.1 type IV-A pilus assembly ATPase PilB [Deltaproteobacteria bacterium]